MVEPADDDIEDVLATELGVGSDDVGGTESKAMGNAKAVADVAMENVDVAVADAAVEDDVDELGEDAPATAEAKAKAKARPKAKAKAKARPEAKAKAKAKAKSEPKAKPKAKVKAKAGAETDATTNATAVVEPVATLVAAAELQPNKVLCMKSDNRVQHSSRE